MVSLALRRFALLERCYGLPECTRKRSDEILKAARQIQCSRVTRLRRGRLRGMDRSHASAEGGAIAGRIASMLGCRVPRGDIRWYLDGAWTVRSSPGRTRGASVHVNLWTKLSHGVYGVAPFCSSRKL